MGLRTWVYKKTGVKLKNFDDSLLSRLADLEKKNLELEQKISALQQPTQLPPDIVLGKETRFVGNGFSHSNVSVGDYTYIKKDYSLQYGTTIGKYCSISARVQIGAYPHPKEWLSTHPFQGFANNPADTPKTTIGNDVWIGVATVIMPGIVVGDGAIIGSNAVVTKDVPPYAIVAGVPAKVISYRFDEPTIKELLSLKWWELDKEILTQNNVDFSNVHEAIEQIKDIKHQQK